MDTVTSAKFDTLSVTGEAPQRNLLIGSLLILALGMLPIYTFSSGGFQLADIPLFIIICGSFFLKDAGIFENAKKQVYLFIPFVIWVAIINGVYYVIEGDEWCLLSALSIGYAFILMFVFSNIYSKLIYQNNLIYIYLGILLSIICCVCLKGYDDESRAVLSFNNANQLGYFAAILLAYAIILIGLKEVNDIKNIKYNIMDIILILSAHLFLFLSVSRSAAVAFIIMDICLLKNIKNKQKRLPILASILIAITFILFFRPTFIQDRLATRPAQFGNQTMAEHLRSRLIDQFESFSGLEIFIGSGTGLKVNSNLLKDIIPKLNTSDGYIEVHNIFGDVLRSYGLIGLSFFVFWVLKLIFNLKIFGDGLWVFAGLMMYNMGNNGIRFRAFWILISLLIAGAAYMKKKKSTCISDIKRWG